MSKKAKNKKNAPAKSASSRSAAARALPFVLVGVALVAGLVLGGLSSDAPADGARLPAAGGPSPAPAIPAAAPQADTAPGGVRRLKLNLAGAPTIGPADAPVTIVEFIDYQCPFCARAHRTVDQVAAQYADDVRLVFLQNPLSFHSEAPLASQAALAAAEQGQFAAMHNVLLANQKALTRGHLAGYAQEIGLDVAAFERALDSGRYAEQVAADQLQASRVGATATPYFFVNGRELRGAQPLTAFRQIIDEELAGTAGPTQWVARVEGPRRSGQPAEDPNKVYEIDTAGSIARGREDAPVTIVEFTDYQCTFCSRAQATVQQVLAEYPDDVRLVVKNLPLDFHGQARPAAIAAMAADRQGKYWDYRAKLFENFRALNEVKFVQFAQELDLDMKTWETDRRDPALGAVVDRDMQQAAGVGVRGTPTFFVNGKKLVGAQPFTTFKATIEQNLNGKGGRQAAAR